jgi:hypothetical protein
MIDVGLILAAAAVRGLASGAASGAIKEYARHIRSSPNPAQTPNNYYKESYYPIHQAPTYTTSRLATGYPQTSFNTTMLYL